MTLICIDLMHFPLLYLQWKSHWCDKKLDTWFFHPQSVSDKRDVILCNVWYIFYIMSKQFFIFWSPFSFNSAMPNWDFEANMLSDRWPTTFQSIISATFELNWIWTSWAVDNVMSWSKMYDKNNMDIFSSRFCLIPQYQTMLSNCPSNPCNLSGFQGDRSSLESNGHWTR